MTSKETVSMRELIRVKRAVAYAAMWGGWCGAIGLGLWSVVAYNPSHGHFAPQWVSFGFILLVGIAIAGSTAASRHKMADSIIEAFRAGLTVQLRDSDGEESDDKAEVHLEDNEEEDG